MIGLTLVKRKVKYIAARVFSPTKALFYTIPGQLHRVIMFHIRKAPDALLFRRYLANADSKQR